MGAVAVKIGVFVFGAFLIFIAVFFGYKSVRSIIRDVKEMRAKKLEKAQKNDTDVVVVEEENVENNKE